MAKPPITAERLRELLNYDPGTGVFTWRVRCGARALAGNVAGAPTATGYVAIKHGGKNYLAHRLAWLHVHGAEPTHDIDHIDGNKSNNALANLRDVPRHVNAENQKRARVDNATGYLGVTQWHGKFIAQIGVAGKVRKIGRFETPQEAHQAYLTEKRRLHAGCTI